MTYDNSISRGDASARMPQNIMGKGSKKPKPKDGETSTFRSTPQPKKKR